VAALFLVGEAHYLAAHGPTAHWRAQTSTIARRVHPGDQFDDD
jgi:hypothetical protein